MVRNTFIVSVSSVNKLGVKHHVHVENPRSNTCREREQFARDKVFGQPFWHYRHSQKAYAASCSLLRSSSGWGPFWRALRTSTELLWLEPIMPLVRNSRELRVGCRCKGCKC